MYAAKEKQERGPIRRSSTNLPPSLQRYAEMRSGIALNDVHVHYDSPRPAQLLARAYTQGTDIYLAPGERACLRHELAHVIQQKQGRVRANGSIGGMPLSDDIRLEKEADRF